jgi:hypothetical protein
MNILLKLRRKVGHGGFVPAGWRMAWYDSCRRAGIYYLAPFHWIVRALREFKYRLRIALRAPGTEGESIFEMQRKHFEQQRASEQYARGYTTGWHECFAKCLEEIEEELRRMDAVRDVDSLLAGLEKRRHASN